MTYKTLNKLSKTIWRKLCVDFFFTFLYKEKQNLEKEELNNMKLSPSLSLSLSPRFLRCSYHHHHHYHHPQSLKWIPRIYLFVCLICLHTLYQVPTEMKNTPKEIHREKKSCSTLFRDSSVDSLSILLSKDFLSLSSWTSLFSYTHTSL